MRTPIKLGMFMMPLHPTSRCVADTLREDREAVVLADQLGYEEAFVGEHVTDISENVASCIAFLASLVDSTSRIKLGTGTCNLPNQHPAHIAAQVAMLDHLSGGRVIFGISPGGLMSDAEAFGNLERDRNEMFVESINMILDIWSGDAPYNLTGKYWSVSTAKTMIAEIGQGSIVRPLQMPHPPIVGTAVAPHSAGVTEMAKRGWGPISANFLLPKWVASHWPKYVAGREAVGAIASPSEWRVAKSIFVADTEEEARAYVYGPKSPYAFYFQQLARKLVGGGQRANLFKPDSEMPDDAITTAYLLENLVISGTVESVVAQLLKFRQQTGEFGTLLYACHDWVDRRLGTRSMELMAREVMPRMNASILAEIA